MHDVAGRCVYINHTGNMPVVNPRAKEALAGTLETPHHTNKQRHGCPTDGVSLAWVVTLGVSQTLSAR